jgi:glutaconate CoA-transferase subunit A
VVLLADAIVHTDCMRQFPNLVRIPGVIVDAVVYWPFAAWPQGSPGMYEIDESHMKHMNGALGSEAGTASYANDFVRSYGDLDGYLDLIGRERMAQLGQGPTGFLLDPYRRWILEHEETLALVGAGAGPGQGAGSQAGEAT